MLRAVVAAVTQTVTEQMRVARAVAYSLTARQEETEQLMAENKDSDLREVVRVDNLGLHREVQTVRQPEHIKLMVLRAIRVTLIIPAILAVTAETTTDRMHRVVDGQLLSVNYAKIL
jgi:hypothetical protein